MSLSTAPPPQSTPTSSRNDLLHNVSLGAFIICPVIMLLPPRKFDIYTVGLLVGFGLGCNHLSYEYTGRTMLARLQGRIESLGSDPLPPKAKEMQRRLREERAARAGGVPGLLSRDAEGAMKETDGGVLAAVKSEEEERRKKMGILEKVWMGNEGDDWKAKRDQREKEALEEGKGYGHLIMEQIWEVWNWGRDKEQEVKEEDERVVREEKGSKK